MQVRAALATLTLALCAGCSSPDSSTTPAAAPPPTSPPAAAQSPARGVRYLADDLPLLPDGIRSAQYPPDVIRASYLFAARHPEVLNYIPCFCGCERAGHKGSHDCFIAGRDAKGKVTAWDHHGIECGVCLDVAYTSMQMSNAGASVPAIRAAIDKKYKSDGHSHGGTPTPMPPKGPKGSIGPKGTSGSGTFER